MKRLQGQMASKSLPGFSLVELVLVIAIMASLAAIILPVFSKVRDKARQSICMSNLRQVDISLKQYLADYDGYYPYAISNWTRYHGDYWQNYPFYNILTSLPALQDVLHPYCRNRYIFMCPSDTGGRSDLYPPLKPSVFAVLGMSYYFDEHLGLLEYNEAAIKSPSSSVYAYDQGRDWHSFQNAPIWAASGSALYIDGHVRFVNGAEALQFVRQLEALDLN